MEPDIIHAAPVFVVSDNVISSLGWTTQENMEAMEQGRSGICSDPESPFPGTDVPLSLIDKHKLKLKAEACGLRSFTTLEQLCILSIQEALCRAPADFFSSRTQIILSTTKGNVTLLQPDGVIDSRAFLPEMARNVARYFGLKNTPLVVSNACISGVLAIELGADLIRQGTYDDVVVVGADLVTPFVLSGFASFKSISAQPCRPYDAQRDGLSLGEAAATIVLSGRNVPAVMAPVYVLGGGCSNDANHISGPSRTGDGLFLAIREALSGSGMLVKDISWINAHGTATLFNDEMEAKAMALAGMSDTPLNAYKGYFGHTLGASGVLETVLSVASLRNQQLMGTLGFSEPGVSLPLGVVKEPVKAVLSSCLKTASGFGGCNAALVFSLLESQVPAPLKSSFEVLAQCRIEKNRILMEEEVVFSEEGSCEAFVRAAFKSLGRPYMKFYKMDTLSKLAFTASEFLISHPACADYLQRDVALVLSNRASSLDTDRQHVRLCIENGGEASPAVFVYTLPNVLMGELCIRHKWQGRNLFFVSDVYDEVLLKEYVSYLFGAGKAEACIYGWVDLLEDDYSVCLNFCVREGLSLSQEKGGL